MQTSRWHLTWEICLIQKGLSCWHISVWFYKCYYMVLNSTDKHKYRTAANPNFSFKIPWCSFKPSAHWHNYKLWAYTLISRCLYANRIWSSVCVCECTHSSLWTDILLSPGSKWFLHFQYGCQVVVLLRTILFYKVTFTYYSLMTTVHQFKLCHFLSVETNAKSCTCCQNQTNECIILFTLIFYI